MRQIPNRKMSVNLVSEWFVCGGNLAVGLVGGDEDVSYETTVI